MKTLIRRGCIIAALGSLIVGCKPKVDVVDAAPATTASTPTLDPSASTIASSAPLEAGTDPSGAPPAAKHTTTAAASAKPACAANMTPFFGHGGQAICEISCTVDKDCPAPKTCHGAGQLLNADGSMGPAHKYCNASTACPGANNGAFWGHLGKPTCEVLCTADKDCAAPKTCKGAGQLVNADGTMGPAHKYCL